MVFAQSANSVADSISHTLTCIFPRVSFGVVVRYYEGAICPECKSSNCRLAHRRNLNEVAMSFVGMNPFRCRECRTRFWKVRGRVWDGSLVSLLSILTQFCRFGVFRLRRARRGVRLEPPDKAAHL